VLVFAEVALSVVLLVAAGLLVKSLTRLLSVDPGFRAQGLLTATLPRFGDEETDETLRAFADALLARVDALPGVEAAAISSQLPLSGHWNDYFFAIDGSPPAAAGEKLNANVRSASDRYFDTMRVPLVRGRVFTRADAPGAPPVVVVNETMARQFFGGEDPLGRRLVIDTDPPLTAEIVGVVAAVRHRGLDADPVSEIYTPFAQAPLGFMNLVARTRIDPASLAPAVRAAVRDVDRGQVVTEMLTMDDRIAATTADSRFRAALLGGFAAVALLLAAIGLYGVIAGSVAERTAEIGIRMALGARAGDVVAMVLGQAARVTLGGVAAGLLAALALGRVLSGLLFGVASRDAATYLLVAAVTSVVALAASWLPARRATRVDPLVALRAE
jgi:predicted permease